MLSPHPFAAALKARDDVRILHLTPGNRHSALGEAVVALWEMLR